MNRLIPEDLLGILPRRRLDMAADNIMLRQPGGLRLNAGAVHLRKVRRMARELAVPLGGTLKTRSQWHGFGREFIMHWPPGNRS